MIRRAFCLAVCSGLLGGCVSGYIAGLPSAEPLAGAVPPGPRPSVYLEVRSNHGAGMAGQDDLEQAVDKASREPGLFSWFTRDPERGAAADYRVAISLSCHVVQGSFGHDSFTDKLAFSVEAGTLCVIPCGGGQIACRMSGSVAGRGGGTEKTYEVHETVGAKLYGFYSIPVGLMHDPKDVLENEVRTLYRQMLDGHAFDASVPGPQQR